MASRKRRWDLGFQDWIEGNERIEPWTRRRRRVMRQVHSIVGRELHRSRNKIWGPWPVGGGMP